MLLMCIVPVRRGLDASLDDGLSFSTQRRHRGRGRRGSRMKEDIYIEKRGVYVLLAVQSLHSWLAT